MATSTLGRITEKMLTQAIVDCARRLGWSCYHTYDSRKSAPGFPDLCLVKGDRLLFAELKVGRNRTTPEQNEWLAALRRCGVDVYVWYDTHWLDGSVEAVLKEARP